MASEPVVPAPPAFPPGIYPNLSFDEYARIPAINFSVLSKFKDTAAHAKVGMLREDAPTPSQRLGSMIHMALLEPDRFKSSVAVRPKLDRRTKEGKAAWMEFELKNKDKEIVDDEQYDVCRGLMRSAAEHISAREILRGPGAAELTFVWVDEEFGILCKSRIDRVGELGGYPVFLDVKSMGDVASLRNMERSIGNYDYAEQAAMYLHGGHVLAPLPEGHRKFLWLACETFEPYLVRLFECADEALEYGYQRFREHLRQYALCRERDHWPGYEGGVETAGLPAWMGKAFSATL